MAEIFDVVNDSDEVIGRAPRAKVHGDPSLIHRVAHVLVFDSEGRLFLQKRAATKDVQPGKWDTSVGGHVDRGESYDSAAIREMAEELAITGTQPKRLYRYLHANEYESEMVTTYRVVSDGEITTDPDEIEEGRFWSLGEIDSADPRLFTPNFLDELARYRDLAGSRPGSIDTDHGGSAP